MPTRRALLLATLLALPLAAEGPSFRAEGGLAEYVRRDRWTFVRIEARGGDDDFAGLAQVDSTASDGTEARTFLPVEVPRGGRKRFEVYHRVQGTSSVWAKVLDAEGHKVYGEGVRNGPAEPRWAVGVLAPSLAGLDGYRQATSQGLAAIGLSPIDLPRRPQGLDALDWLLWPEPDPQQLLPEQVEAIVEWVRGGGRLCLCVAKGVEAVNASPLAALLPCAVERAEPTEMGGTLAEEAGAAVPLSEPTLVARLRARDQILAIAEGRPVAVRGRFGLGEVVLVAFDPLAAPFDKWKGREALWIRFLGLDVTKPATPDDEGYYNPNYSPTVVRLSPAQAWVQKMEAAPLGDKVEPDVITTLFAIYILVVGVGDYVWWKLKKRRFGLWWTTPVWVAVFGFAGWKVGTIGRREADLLRTATVFDRRLSESTWNMHGAATIYVGGGGSLTVRASTADGCVWPAAGVDEMSSAGRPSVSLLQTPQGVEAPDLRMFSASMLSFLAEGRGEVPELAGLGVTANEDSVTIENKTSLAWKDGWLFRGGRCFPIAPKGIAAGETTIIDADARGWLGAEKARDRARREIGFESNVVEFWGRSSRYYHPRTDFGPGATQHVLRVLLDAWAERPDWSSWPAGVVPRTLDDPCLLLVASDGPCGVAIDPPIGQRVSPVAVRIWLDEEGRK